MVEKGALMAESSEPSENSILMVFLPLAAWVQVKPYVEGLTGALSELSS
jgi:hypothetical protein